VVMPRWASYIAREPHLGNDGVVLMTVTTFLGSRQRKRDTIHILYFIVPARVRTLMMFMRP
jgi:hypothetical protein